MPTGLDDVKGIPEFWADVLLNCYEVEGLIQGEDLDILKHLTDITSDLHEDDLVRSFPAFTNSFPLLSISGLHAVLPLLGEPLLLEPRAQEVLRDDQLARPGHASRLRRTRSQVYQGVRLFSCASV